MVLSLAPVNQDMEYLKILISAITDNQSQECKAH